jgi:hypothetical protein
LASAGIDMPQLGQGAYCNPYVLSSSRIVVSVEFTGVLRLNFEAIRKCTFKSGFNPGPVKKNNAGTRCLTLNLGGG